MRCTTCGYSLANLRSRTCPECGSGFKPTDFEFAPGTVAFCCPHCDQDYYGTTVDGHLYPNAFNCAKCNQHVHMDEMLMRPAEGLEATDTEVHNVPWSQRDQIGRFKAFRQTVAMAVGHPSEFGLGRPQESETRDALHFAAYSILFVGLGWVISQVFLQVFMLGCFIPAMTPGPRGPAGPGANPFSVSFYLSMLGGQLFGVLIAVPLGLLFLWIWALSAHGILKLTGKVELPAYASKRAFYYAAGANILTLIPCLGWLIGGPWTTVSSIVALKSSQRISAGRATLAALPLPILVTAISVGFMYWSFSAAMTATGAGFGPFNPSTEMLTQRYVSWSNLNRRYPKHMVELVMDNTIMIGDLIETNSLTMYEDLVLGSFDSNAADDLYEPNRAQAFQAYLASLPPNILAYRFGDFVFYPSPQPPNQTAPSRWLIVAWPAPISNSPLGPTELVEVGLADGTTQYHLNAAFPQMLANENTARAQAGLPPIPHPSSVTQASLVLAPVDGTGIAPNNAMGDEESGS